MKIVKIILIGIAAVIAMILISALFIKKEFALERSVVINQPKDAVFAYLKSLKSQNEWSTWGKKDPNMKTEYIGTDGTVGFISKWEGNKDVGKGEQEMKKIIEGEEIENELRFETPMKSVAKAIFYTKAESDQSTKVTWRLEGNSNYPMNFMNLFNLMEQMVGKDFEEGLANLKAKMEK